MENVSIKIDDNQYEAEFDSRDESHIRIDGKDFKIQPLRDYGNNVYSININNRVVLAQIDDDGNLAGGAKFKILHDNFEYKAEIKTKTRFVIEEFIQASGGADDAHPHILAPMPGMVVKLPCNEGDVVKKGDKLIIIEAMKMENALASPVDGKVSKIFVKEGDAVDKDADLIELEIEE